MNEKELQQKANEVAFYLRAFPTAIKTIAFIVNIVSAIAGLIMYPFSFLKNRISPKKADGTWSAVYSLDSKRWKYMSLKGQVTDQYGFIEYHEADCLMFSGLYSAGGCTVDLKQAQDKEGRWYRKPLYYKNWYPAQTASTISRDMMLGVFWHIWNTKDITALLKTYRYGSKNHWIMGEGDIARIYLTPGLQATLAEMIIRMPYAYSQLSLLEKIHCFILSKKPQVWPTKLMGYQLHLDMLHAALRGLIIGYIDSSMKEAIEEAHEREFLNPLVGALYAKYVDGKYDPVISTLMSEKYWPENRLPTSVERSEQWLPQRSSFNSDGSMNRDWLPDLTPPPKTHSGGDFIFVSKFISDWISDSRSGKV